MSNQKVISSENYTSNDTDGDATSSSNYSIYNTNSRPDSKLSSTPRSSVNYLSDNNTSTADSTSQKFHSNPKRNRNYRSRKSKLNCDASKLCINDHILFQVESLEKFVWSYKSDEQTVKNMSNLPIDIIFKLLISGKNRLKIYDFFGTIQFQRCCPLLTNLHIGFDHKINIKCIQPNDKDIIKLNELNDILPDDNTDSDKNIRMVLYYSTLCAMYPSLFTTEILSRSNTSSSENSDADELAADEYDDLLLNGVKSKKNQMNELETTSEGLCDYIREIFYLNRQSFSEYQNKAMKKLVVRKSHPQILKEELKLQYHLVNNDQHPIYKRENFQSQKSYDVWKDRFLNGLKILIDKFSHIQIDENELFIEERLNNYKQRLNSFLGYFERLVIQMFSLANNTGFKLTSNSRRLLKEFQLRNCIDAFDSLIIELKCFFKYLHMGNNQFFEILIGYFKNIYMYLNLNSIESEPQHYPIQINSLFNLISILENTHGKIVLILRDLKSFYPDADSKSLNILFALMDELGSLNELLNRTSSISVDETIKIQLEIGIDSLYKQTRDKIQEKNKTEDNQSAKIVDTNTVYSMIIFCNEQIDFYKKLFSKSSIKFSSIKHILFKVLYENLITDVRKLFEDHLDELYDSSKLNLNLLALAYRLNQFDLKHRENIKTENQVWRNFILPHLYNWITVIGKIVSKMIFVDFVPSDEYKSFDLKKIDSEMVEKLKELDVTNLKNLLNTSRNNPNLSYSSDGSPNLDLKPSAFRRVVTRRIGGVDSQINSSEQTSNSEAEIKLDVYRKLSLKRASNIGNIKNNTRQNLIRFKAKHSLLNDNNNSNNNNNNNSNLNELNETYAQNGKKQQMLKKRKNTISSIESNTSTDTVTSRLTDAESRLKQTKPTEFVCSSSLVDLYLLIFRFKDICNQLIDTFIPAAYCSDNLKFFQTKFNCLNNIYQESFRFIDIYANNMFALEICATSKSNLEKFFGPEMIKELFEGKMGNIWGCRHKLKHCKYKCDEFIDKNCKYISDKYEPVCETMCIRLNNLIQLKQLRKYLFENFNRSIQKCYQSLLKNKNRQTLAVLNQLKFDLCKTRVVNKTLEMKLDKLINGLLNLLVYRFNLFCKKAFFMLLSDELNSYPLIIRLKPLTDFLSLNFKMLKRQFFDNVFVKFLKILWNYFHESFNELVKTFDDKSAQNPKNQAVNYSKLIDIMLLKFKENTTSHKFFEHKMKKLKFVLNLYSQNTNNLILVYYKLFNFNLQKENGQQESSPQFNRLDLKHLVMISKLIKRPFNGKYFIGFLKKYPPFSDKDYHKDYLIKYCQNLLESSYIELLPSKNKVPKTQKNSKQTIENDTNTLMEKYGHSQHRLNYESFNNIFYEKLFLATKSHVYKLNIDQINKLTDNLLFRNSLLNREIETLYCRNEINLNTSIHNTESNHLFDKCLQYSLSHEFIMKILWHRIYDEPLVMKFISMRYSNYVSNVQPVATANPPPQNEIKNYAHQSNDDVYVDEVSYFPFY